MSPHSIHRKKKSQPPLLLHGNGGSTDCTELSEEARTYGSSCLSTNPTLNWTEEYAGLQPCHVVSLQETTVCWPGV